MFKGEIEYLCGASE